MPGQLTPEEFRVAKGPNSSAVSSTPQLTMGTVSGGTGSPFDPVTLPWGGQLPVMGQEPAHSQRSKCPQNWEMLLPTDLGVCVWRGAWTPVGHSGL